MPAVVVASIISAAASATSSALASRSASGAAKRATAASVASNQAALDFEREQEATRQQEWEQTQAENRRQYDLALERERQDWLTDVETKRRAETRDVETYNAESARRQPYRDTSWAAVQKLAGRAGLSVVRTAAPQLALPPPAPTMADLATSGYPPVTGRST